MINIPRPTEKKILKRISLKSIKLFIVGKKDKLLGKLRVFGVKTKVGYNSLDINEKAKAAGAASVDSSKNFFSNIRNIFTKEIRHVTHFSLILVIFIVILTGIPAPEMAANISKKQVDPLGIRKITAETEAGEKPAAVVAVANIISTIDTSPESKLTSEAFQVADQQVAKTNLALSGDSIMKLASIETTSSAKQKAGVQKYIVQGGDTLSGIAAQFGVTTDSIKWSNGMSDADSIKPGSELLIPSVTGIFYTLKSGDTIEGIAAKYKTTAALIISQNDLYGEDIKAGMQIVIPDGVIEEAPPPPPVVTPRTQYASNVPSYIPTSSGSNRFPWGYCTWYVASRRSIPWNGNAWQWYGNAQAFGRSVGRTPVPGAVMVTWESSVGHVAYVESVNGNTFTVSEMNYVGYGRTSSRTVTTSSVPLIGFIY